MKATIITTGKKEENIIKTLAGDVVIPDKLESGLSKEEFVQLFNLGVPIDNFIGGLEKEIAILDEDVPSTFLNNTTGEEETPRKFKDYCNHFISLDGTKTALMIGERDKNGNRANVVPNEELKTWVDYFGIENILTKSEYLSKISSDEYSIKD